MTRGTASRARASRARPRRPPDGFSRLFWEYPAGAPKLGSDLELVVRRVTAEGGWREIRLLRRRVGDAAIRDVIERTEARGLSPQRVRFWQLLLGLEAARADAWVRAAQASTWAGRSSR